MKHTLRAACWMSALLAIASIGVATAADMPFSKPVLQALRRSHVLVIGGSGRNGSAIVAALEAAGAHPQALTRDIAKARAKLGEHRWVQGDVTQPATLDAAFHGVDVVIDAAATRSLDGPNGTDAVDREGARNVVAAAQRAHVKRLLVITGMAVGAMPANAPPPMVKVLGAKRDAERLFAASGIDYVILRPTGILERPAGEFAVRLADPAQYHPAPEEFAMRAPSAEELKAGPPPGTVSLTDLALVTAFCAVDKSAANKTFVVTQVQPAAPARADWAQQLTAIAAVNAAASCKDAVTAALACGGAK
jgi:uncharacterized protein YbjT (DUF2867 family)